MNLNRAYLEGIIAFISSYLLFGFFGTILDILASHIGYNFVVYIALALAIIIAIIFFYLLVKKSSKSTNVVYSLLIPLALLIVNYYTSSYVSSIYFSDENFLWFHSVFIFSQYGVVLLILGLLLLKKAPELNDSEIFDV